ncbi:hypothetical protein NA57DRAFT_57522 [Rhizodiscina lignyota]|uniref:Uncharacterized protein n=1 Tax=Rhizodiscina lignyota TaxID=1504668 RepID=A0A9P4MA27_9PEZI|nr:hypothetical protein NA57DRAFT_57522 [Rhizodiscina lignyota]
MQSKSSARAIAQSYTDMRTVPVNGNIPSNISSHLPAYESANLPVELDQFITRIEIDSLEEQGRQAEAIAAKHRYEARTHCPLLPIERSQFRSVLSPMLPPSRPPTPRPRSRPLTPADSLKNDLPSYEEAMKEKEEAKARSRSAKKTILESWRFMFDALMISLPLFLS